MNIVKDNTKTLSYVKAQPRLPWSTGLPVNEIIKKEEKSERWMVKESSRKGRFWRQETKGKAKVLNKAVTIYGLKQAG